MKTKNMMIATIGTVLLLSVGCTSKNIQPTERIPAQEEKGTGDIGSSTENQVQFQIKKLTKPFKIKLISADGKINFKGYTTKLIVDCTYKKFSLGRSIFEPSPGFGIKRCGEYVADLKMNSNDEIEVPAIASMADSRSSNLNNLKIQICAETPKSTLKSNEDFCIVASGSDQINQLIDQTKPAYLSKLKISDLSVKLNSENIFRSTELLGKRDPAVWIRFETSSCTYGDRKNICVTTDLNNYSYGYVSDNSNNDLGNIFKANKISTPEVVLGTYGTDNQITVNVSIEANYNKSTVENVGEPKTLAEKTIKVPYNVQSLQLLRDTEFNLISK